MIDAVRDLDRPQWPILFRITAIWVLLDSLHSAFVMFRYPHTFNKAYELVGAIAPWSTWGVAWMSAPVLVMLGWHRGRSLIVIWGMLVYSAMCYLFGFSILSLVVDESPGAFIGAGKWLAVATFVAVVSFYEGEKAIEA